ncbi:MAG: ROK family protein [Pseudomonadota bacterium]|jgi:fructokinase
MIRIGVDLGGSKIEVAALDEQGRELARRRVATPRGDYLGTVSAVAGLVEQVENELGQRGSVGVGTPGAISAVSGLMKNCNSTWLNGKPLLRDLEGLLHREVRIANDANCFALAEAVDGAAQGAGSVFGVILGTGVGGGIVIRGHLVTGANAIAGEWGHNPLPFLKDGDHPLPPCYCGQHGCIETYLSGPGLARDHVAAGGAPLAPPGIVAAAAAGDAACEASLCRYEDRLARALAHVINLLDPEVIVLGGGLSHITRLYTHVPQRWSAYVFSDHVATRLLPNRHGDSGGVRGAAWLWD